jgi:hypothetical protein
LLIDFRTMGFFGIQDQGDFKTGTS